MAKPVLFFSELCPDTKPFITELKNLQIDYEAIEITTSMVNLKRFLKLRDNNPIFDSIKQKGYIGIPALLLSQGDVILDIHQLSEITN